MSKSERKTAMAVGAAAIVLLAFFSLTDAHAPLTQAEANARVVAQNYYAYMRNEYNKARQ